MADQLDRERYPSAPHRWRYAVLRLCGRFMAAGCGAAHAALLLALGGLLLAGPVHAQVVVDPLTIEFTPSTDHNTVVNGTAVVSRYDVGFYLVGASSPFQTESLGKPAPATDGIIRVPFTALSSRPSPGITYESRITAVGPGGSAVSLPSNTFAFSLTCSYTASPANQTVVGAGGIGTASVTAPTGCTWTASANAAWISITSGSSGSGNGVVSFTVAANPGTTQRSGTLTVAGQTLTVTQSGAACSFAVTPTTHNLTSAAGGATVTVTAATGCTWSATSNATSWLTITAGASGSGNGTTTFAVSANSGAARTGTLTVAGQTVTVIQAAPCSFTVAPTSMVFYQNGGLIPGSVTTTTGCGWGITNPAGWLTVTPSTATGTGTFQVTAAANAGATRSATLTVAGRTVSVSQAGAACAPLLSRINQELESAARTFTVGIDLVSGSGCPWVATSDAAWLTITAGASGTGSGTVTIAAAANTSSSGRAATLTIAGIALPVTQAAAGGPSSPTGVHRTLLP